MRHVFNEIATKRTRRWVDPDTGKKRQKTRKFFQTINPFNKAADGQAKTVEQILVEINAEADAWVKGQP